MANTNQQFAAKVAGGQALFAWPALVDGLIAGLLALGEHNGKEDHEERADNKAHNEEDVANLHDNTQRVIPVLTARKEE